MSLRQLVGKLTRNYSSSAKRVLEKGTLLEISRTFSDSDITCYSKLSLDANPLHFNAECARDAGFEDRIVHGMLVASLFPRIIASHFPGAIYVSQTLQFKLPVYVGEEIKGVVQATNIRAMKDKYLAKFETKCFKDNGLLVIDGEATAVLPTLIIEHD